MIKPLIIAGSIALLSSSVYAGSANRNSNDNSSRSGAFQAQGQDASVANKISTSLSVGGDVHDYADIPVSGAFAPNIVATDDCSGSISAGAQGQFFGLSLGGTRVNKGCETRENAKVVASLLGDKEATISVLCTNPSLKEAFSNTNTISCPKKRVKVKFNTTKNTTNQRINSGDCEYPTPQCKTRRGK